LSGVERGFRKSSAVRSWRELRVWMPEPIRQKNSMSRARLRLAGLNSS